VNKLKLIGWHWLTTNKLNSINSTNEMQNQEKFTDVTKQVFASENTRPCSKTKYFWIFQTYHGYTKYLGVVKQGGIWMTNIL
jgi:hypothetical protein